MASWKREGKRWAPRAHRAGRPSSARANLYSALVAQLSPLPSTPTLAGLDASSPSFAMRFGRTIHQHRIPEWAPHYIDYYHLKRCIKLAIRDATERQSGIDLTDTRLHHVVSSERELIAPAFTTALDSDLSHVQKFYSDRLASLRQHYDILIRQSGIDKAVRPSELHEQAAAITACLQYRLATSKLRWYGKVNADGLRCLTRKIAYISPNADCRAIHSPAYEFVHQSATLKELEGIDDFISTLLSSLQRINDPLDLDAAREAHLQQSRNRGQALLRRLDRGLQDDTPSTQRNVVHSLVISASYESTLKKDVHNRERYEALLASLGSEMTDHTSMFQSILETLSPDQRPAILQRDHCGRSPLHYAAEAGLPHLCEIILRFMNQWSMLDTTTDTAYDLTDHAGNSPLHLSVTNGHETATRVLLSSTATLDSYRATGTSLGDTLASLLHIALQYDATSIVEDLLATHLVNLDYHQSNGETALLIASRAGSVEHIRMLAESPSWQPPYLNEPGSSYGWTPLIVACIFDHFDAVKVLLELGAEESRADVFGWTALDHVAFRGYWKIASILQKSFSRSTERISKVPLRSTNALPLCSPSTTRIFVNIGPLNTRKFHSPVDLSPLLSRYPFNPYPEAGYHLTAQGLGANGLERSLDLPVLDDTTNYPSVFHTTEPSNAKLLFALFRQTSTSELPVHIGSAVALLEELGDSLGPGRESLFRDHIIPIIGCDGFQFLGTLTVNFLLVKPFPDPRKSSAPSIDKDVWNGNGKTKLIGHRGEYHVMCNGIWLIHS